MNGVFLAVAMMATPQTHSALLEELSQKAVRYFWEQSNPATGLTKDRAANLKNSDEYTVASVAATGFALSAYAVGAHRGWLSRKGALDRTTHTLAWLNQYALKKNGWFYHFIDWRNGERVWNSEVSSIDTALLLSGALMAQSEFKSAAVDKEVSTLLNAIDWHWMLTNDGAKPDELTICMGWNPEHGFIEARWSQQWEEMFLYVLAYGAYPKMPQHSWDAIDRKLLQYKGYDLLLGGPIFMHQMSQGFLDFCEKRDRLGYDYWVEGRNACLANRQYCIDNPKKWADYGPDFWGLNAGDMPDGYGGGGAPGYGDDNGTISPTGAIAIVMYDPKVAVSTAESLAKNFPGSMGRYGFANGINPTRRWIDPDVIGIDLGMELLAIENARDGLPNKLSMANPINANGMKALGFTRTKEGDPTKRPLRIKP